MGTEGLEPSRIFQHQLLRLTWLPVTPDSRSSYTTLPKVTIIKDNEHISMRRATESNRSQILTWPQCLAGKPYHHQGLLSKITIVFSNNNHFWQTLLSDNNEKHHNVIKYIVSQSSVGQTWVEQVWEDFQSPALTTFATDPFNSASFSTTQV